MAFLTILAVCAFADQVLAKPGAAPAAAVAPWKKIKPIPKVRQDPGVSAHSNKKIKMVTTTLQDILQSVTGEEKEETAAYNKYTAWCTKEKENLKADDVGTSRNLANEKVLAEERKSKIDELNLFIKKTTKTIQETKDAMAQADTIRNKELADYTKEMAANTQSLSSIKQAIAKITKVKKVGGFLQDGVVEKLRINAPGESSYVLGIMKGLEERLGKTRVTTIKKEKEKVAMHNTFMKTKGADAKLKADALSAKKIELSETNAKYTMSKVKIQKFAGDVAEVKVNIVKTDQACKKAAHEWTLRQADRVKEKAALNQAIKTLQSTAFIQSISDETDDELEFVQMSSKRSRSDDGTGEDASGDIPDAAFAALETNAEEQIEGKAASAAEKQAFTGVKTVVTKLIAEHQETQKVESAKKKACRANLKAKKAAKSDATDALAVIKATIAKKRGEVQMDVDEIAKANAAIANIKKRLGEAAAVRRQSNALYTKGSRDRATALKILQKAIVVLQSFYTKKKNKLIEIAAAPAAAAPAPVYKVTKRQAPTAWRTTSSRKDTASSGAIGMIQNIADDIVQEEKDALTAENQASRAHKQLEKQSRKDTDSKQQEILANTIAKAKLGVQINGLLEDQTQKDNELKGLNLQLVALHKECDELLKSFDSRVKARSFEVSQLRDVMDILSGSTIATRT